MEMFVTCRGLDMLKTNEGVRRLSLVLGLVFSVPLCLLLFGIASQTDFDAGDLLNCAAAVVASFVIPWGSVRIVAWIVEGFRQK